MPNTPTTNVFVIDVRLRRVPDVKAEALLEAAADLYSDHGADHPLSVATWLRDRAAALVTTPAGDK